MKKIPTKGLTYEEWVDLRLKLVYEGKIGGSDASTILGLNPWTSKITRWNQSLGLSNIKNIDNEVMFHGRLLEDYVAKLWKYWTGDPIAMINNFQQNTPLRNCIRRNFIFINEKYPWIFANIDRQITEHDTREGLGILEVKTISSFNSDKWDGGIPPYYIVQCQLYMLVLEYSYCDIAFLVDGRHMNVFTVEANEDIQNTILQESKDFYDSIQEAKKILNTLPGNIDEEEKYNHVSHLEPSLEDEYKVDLDSFLSEKHKAMKSRVKIEGNEELENLTKIYCEHRDGEKKLKLAKQKTAQDIKSLMIKRGAEEIDFGSKGKIVWGKTFNVRYQDVVVENLNF
mgnify:CR=1 FL=1|tara:strand:+ start:693 stop:1715 length:1023 start_codon:yes stop_codon:yes gene_type:complete